MSKTNVGCEICGTIGAHFHSWQADMGTLPRINVNVKVTLVPSDPAPMSESPTYCDACGGSGTDPKYQGIYVATLGACEMCGGSGRAAPRSEKP